MALDWRPIHDTDPILHQAAFIGDLKSIKILLQNRTYCESINVRNRLGCSPLRLAATGGHAECVEYLIKTGANVDLIDMKAQTPLFVAIKNKHLRCACVLLQAGANPNGDCASLCTPLYIAAMEGFLDGVKILLKYNAEIDRCLMFSGKIGNTPLYIALTYRRFDCFRELLLAGADPNVACGPSASQSLYSQALRRDLDPEYIRLLYECGASISKQEDLTYHLSRSCGESRDLITHLLGRPRTLLSCCRLTVRHALGKHRLLSTDLLPLPAVLKAYIRYDF